VTSRPTRGQHCADILAYGPLRSYELPRYTIGLAQSRVSRRYSHLDFDSRSVLTSESAENGRLSETTHYYAKTPPIETFRLCYGRYNTLLTRPCTTPHFSPSSLSNRLSESLQFGFDSIYSVQLSPNMASIRLQPRDRNLWEAAPWHNSMQSREYSHLLNASVSICSVRRADGPPLHSLLSRHYLDTMFVQGW